MDGQKVFDAENPLGVLDYSEDNLRAAIAAADPAPEEAVVRQMIEAEANGKTRKGVTAFLLSLLPAPPEDERLAFGRSAAAGDVAGALHGPVQLVLGDGEHEIAGLARIDAAGGDFDLAGGRAMYRRPIRVEGADVAATIQSVALVGPEDELVAVCEIPGGLPLAGRSVEMPAGSLVFG